jgi:XTP/dITP diphosphohydrolase
MSVENGRTILIATSNRGKRAEFERLLPSTVRIVALDDPDVRVQMPAETGTSYAEIAATKALAAAEQSGWLTVADDSGLEVDALDGAPGLRTARFAGEPPTDDRNRALLLSLLADVSASRRTARFRCAVALAEPGRVVAVTEGTCAGRIGTSEVGTRGFGYDPLFVLDDGRTMAELTDVEKDRVSHRGRAIRAMLPRLLAALETT